jgi:cell surface protein SprA
MTLKNDMTARFDYKKSRNLTMSFQDYQLSEQNSEEFTIGAGYRWTGVKLGFIKIGGKPLNLENDFAFNFDFSYRDSKTNNYSLDQGSAPRPTNGMKTIRFAPSLDYTVSERLRITAYYEWSRNVPVLSTSFPNTNSQGGLRINFSLAQ